MSLPNAMLTRRLFVPALVAATVILGVVGFGQPTSSNSGFTVGKPSTGQKGISRTTADIMAADKAAEVRVNLLSPSASLRSPGVENRPQDPNARFDPQIAPGAAKNNSTTPPRVALLGPNFSQTIGLQWDGVTGPTETGSFPPDSMGMAGPSQFIIFVNGRIRSFNKTTGVPTA